MKKSIFIICSAFALASNAQIINTVCGTGTGSYAGDGAQATAAELQYPTSVAFDVAGNMYIADAGNNVIRKVNTSGIISTIAGNSTAGYAGDGGAATAAQISNPYAVTFDSIGNLYVSDAGNGCVRKINTNGVISTYIHSYSQNGTYLIKPSGITFYHNFLYISDVNNGVVLKVPILDSITNSNITVFAGDGNAGYSGDGGVATAARLNGQQGIAFDAVGNMYIADASNNVIRKVNTSGIISTVAGNGTQGFSGDGGAATTAELNNPVCVITDIIGNLYISDINNGRIQMVTMAGIISTFAGNISATSLGDGGAATAAKLQFPTGLACDTAGNLYIADNGNNRIRKVTNASSAGINHVSANNEQVTIYSYNNAIITNGTIPQGTQLKVVNALGQVVLNTALQNNIETNLPSGIYTVQVIDNTGSILEIKKCALISN